MSNSRLIGWDTETHLITDADPVPRLVCLSAAWGEDGGDLAGRARAVGLFEAWLAAPDVVCVAHNLAFDVPVMVRALVESGLAAPHVWAAVLDAYESGVFSDTMIRQQLADIAAGRFGPAMRYDLATLAKRHLGVDVAKGDDTWRLRYAELDGTPIERWPSAAMTYATLDARLALEIHKIQDRKYPAEWLVNERPQVAADLVLRVISVNGMVTDPEAILVLARATVAELAPTIAAAGGLVFRDRAGKIHRRQKMAAELALEAWPDIPRTPTGAPRLDEETTSAHPDPRIRAYGKIARLVRALDTTIPELRAGTGGRVIRSRFRVLQATGRTSSSKPNVQNRSRNRGDREAFVPRPGYVFACADFSSLELHTFAQVQLWMLGRSALARALNAGRDVHLDMGAAILGISYEEAANRKAAGDQVVKDARQLAKVCNFGFPGGLGARGFITYAAGFGRAVTEDQARALKERWLHQWPEAREYFNRIGAMFPEGVEKATIRQFGSGRIRGGCFYTEACNTLFQGLGADVAKAAGWGLLKACLTDQASPLYGGRLVNFIHDEYLVEVSDDDQAHDAAVELGRVMGEAGSVYLPDVPVRAEPLLARRWSKDAEPVFQDGRLVPWDWDKGAA